MGWFLWSLGFCFFGVSVGLLSVFVVLLFFQTTSAGIVYEGCPKRSSPTGEVTFIEEIRDEIRGSHYSTQRNDQQIRIRTEGSTCPYPKSFGLTEFLDMGTKPIPWYTQRYINAPGYPDITDVATFGHLDAYGARLRNGTIEVVVVEGSGLRKKDQTITSELLLHTESCSYGLGYNDSHGLSPPIKIQSVPMKDFLHDLETSTDCYCDMIIEAQLVTILGFVYYPQFGHTLLNGFSNYYSLLKHKQFYPNSADLASPSPHHTILLLHSLQRNTTGPTPDNPHTFYRIMWHDMYDELFSSLVTDINSWDDVLKYSQENIEKKICFQRLMVGSPPHLDFLNATVTAEMWNEFTRFLISLYFRNEINESFNDHQLDSTHEIISPARLMEFDPLLSSRSSSSADPGERCLVTFLVRTIESIPSSPLPPNPESFQQKSRDIFNLWELDETARSLSCQTQFLVLQRLSIKDQILELRWNTTLLVSPDGTGLYNTLFMDECSSTLRVETWKKPGLVPCLGPGKYWTYSPTVNETYWMNKTHSKIGQSLHNLNQTNPQLLQKIPLNSLGYPYEEMESYLRDSQLSTVNKDQFHEIVSAAKRYSRECLNLRGKKSRSSVEDGLF